MKIRRSLEIDFLHNLVCPEFPLSETPFISSLNAQEEYITLYNPSSQPFNLDGFFLADSRKLHYLLFTNQDKIEARSQLYIYCCPGNPNINHNHSTKSAKQTSSFMEPNVLWKNNDGSLRKKEVLNNEHCTMQLHAPNGKCLAACTATNNGPVKIQRRSEEYAELPTLQLSREMRLIICLIRVVVLSIAGICVMFKQRSLFVYLYWIAFLLDILER